MAQQLSKLCRQCGEVKPTPSFRQYYTGRKGTYKMCKACESINYRVKYLSGLDTMSDKQQTELNTIYKLWELQRSLGLEPPDWNLHDKDAAKDLDEQLRKMNSKFVKLPTDVMLALSLESSYVTAPRARLYHWATCELDSNTEPQYYTETVYESLKESFRPQVGMNSTTFLPIHDETYKPVLEYILDRFYKFEDERA